MLIASGLIVGGVGQHPRRAMLNTGEGVIIGAKARCRDVGKDMGECFTGALVSGAHDVSATLVTETVGNTTQRRIIDSKSITMRHKASWRDCW